MAFQYQARDAAAWDKRAKGSVFDGFALDEYQTFSVKKQNLIRILPPTWANAQHYGMDLWVHYGVGPNNGTIICLYKMKNQICPVCQACARAEAQGREDWKELKPTRRVLVWLLDRTEEKTPLLWAMPWTVDRDITKVCRDRQTGELYMIDHPDAGFDVSFDREGEGQQVKYTGIAIMRRPTPVDQKHLDYIIAHPLDSVLNWRSPEEVGALLEGAAVGEAASQPAGTTGTPAPAFNTPMQTAPAPAPVAVAAHTPPPPPPVQVPFPPEGWTLHPSAPGYYYMGQEVLTEADLRARMVPPPPPAAPLPPPIPQAPVIPIQSQPAPVAQPAAPGPVPVAASQAPPAAANSGDSRAASMRARFQTGR